MRTVISDEYDIEAIEGWCANHGVTADWKPLWCHGSVAGWQAECSEDDHFLIRLRFA